MLKSHLEETCSQVPGVLCLFFLLVGTSSWPHRLLAMVAFVSGGELVWPLVLTDAGKPSLPPLHSGCPFCFS